MTGNGVSSSVAPVTRFSVFAHFPTHAAAGILHGTKWGGAVGSGVTVTYSFSQPYVSMYVNYSGEFRAMAEFSPAQKDAAREALRRWEGISNIRFVEVAETNAQAGDIRFAFTDQIRGTATAWGYYPSSAASGGDVWIRTSQMDHSYAPGTYNFFLLLHEIGHAIGLKHPHDTSIHNSRRLTGGDDVIDRTVLSYNEAGRTRASLWPSQPGPVDDVAIDLLYGYNPAGPAGRWQGASPAAGATTPRTHFTIADPADGTSRTVAAPAYAGPVAGLRFQHIGAGGRENILGTTGNDFVNAQGGDDAIDGDGGDDVLDGGTGSNFLTGGAGTDVFFLDGRGGQVSWATITDFAVWETTTLWGFDPAVATFQWAATDGTAGFEGVTLHADLDRNGRIDASITFAGRSLADTQGFRITYGSSDGNPYLAVIA